MATRKSSKPRKPRGSGGRPRAVASTRREQRVERNLALERERRRAARHLGREGERPPGPFGGLPVSEFAILAGLVTAGVGYFDGAAATLITGLVICALGVVEITAREHFSGYRSHAALLAAIPAVAVEAGVGLTVAPAQRLLLLVAVVPVFGVLFWLLRRRFAVARQARVVRPRPPA
ncbi:MAG: hypothetical protein ACYCXW_02930 [Solirubrobacteraceae bacterium]